MTAIGEQLSQLPWSRLSLRYEPTGKRSSYLMKALGSRDFRSKFKDYRINKGTIDNLICPQIQLPDDYQDYLQTGVSSNTRQKIKRFTRKYLDTGELHISHTTPETVERDVDVLLTLWVQKWSGLKGRSSARRIAMKYKNMLMSFSRHGVLNLPILWQSQTPVSALGCLADHRQGHLLFILSGREEQSDIPQTGLLQHSGNIRWAIENNFKIYDFGHGDERYKYSFGAEDKTLHYFSIRRRSHKKSFLFDPLSVDESVETTKQLLNQRKFRQARNACEHLIQIQK